jgi:uncharacterized repeat protein (TIGR03806 family)
MDAASGDAVGTDAPSADAPSADGASPDAASPDAGSTDLGPPPCPPGGDGTYVDAPYPTLSSYCLVGIENGQYVLKAGLPYDLNTPLFSDGATKLRSVWMPNGESAQYNDTKAFDFPMGTILTKTFGFVLDQRTSTSAIQWVETRLLIRTATTWKAYTYVYNDSATEADILYGGDIRTISWTTPSGATETAHYLIPSGSQCRQCHVSDQTLLALGPKARNLNRVHAYTDGPANQLQRWTTEGYLTGAPADPNTAPVLPRWNDPTTGSTVARARAYLDVNCSHCHNPGGSARTSMLFLVLQESTPFDYGVCKTPVAGGHVADFMYDIVPGNPAASLMPYRMESIVPSIAMPQIGRSIVDQYGVKLISDWIQTMTTTTSSCS